MSKVTMIGGDHLMPPDDSFRPPQPSDHEALKAAITKILRKYWQYDYPQQDELDERDIAEATDGILQLIRSSLPEKEDLSLGLPNEADGFNQAIDTMDKLLGGGNERTI